jgi:hypothetical protein
MIQSSTQRLILFVCIMILGGVPGAQNASSQNLTTRLLDQTNETLAAQVRMRGDPIRGALLFHTSSAGCIKCHSDGQVPSPLGPKLTDIHSSAQDTHLIESVLNPSKALRKGYETVSIVTTDGKVKQESWHHKMIRRSFSVN